MDEQRVRVALETINSFVQKDVNGVVTLKPGVTLEHLVSTVIRDVGTFTMRFFTGPAMAENLDAAATVAEKERQTKLREYTKDQLERLGARRATLRPGVVIPPLNLAERVWRPDLLQPGEISPRRGPVVSGEEALQILEAM